jgi:aryl-alcohol dehydrogenase-like predicted oxidoreductase
MADLPKRLLGRTGMQVTALGYGSMDLRGAASGRSTREVSEEQAERILNALLDAGVNYIDTSIDYGLSEERIGKYIGHRRSEYFLASKCGCLVGGERGESGYAHVFTRENIVAGVNQSLRRLQTDYLDLVQFHASPSKAQLEEHGGLQALLDLQSEGKVRFIGMSGTIPNLEEQIDMGVFDVFQIPYSALQREHEDLIRKASEGGAGIVVRGGIAQGAPAREEGKPWDRWQQAELSTTIVGTVNPQHLEDNVKSLLKGPLPAAVYEEARRRLTAAEPSS